jgi:hypothetical protein
MNKELYKSLILGISFIIGIIIYTEQTKYELHNGSSEGFVKYLILNKSNGDVSTYFINLERHIIYESTIDGNINIIEKKNR